MSCIKKIGLSLGYIMSTFMHTSFIIGSYSTFFALSTILGPLVGYFSATSSILIVIMGILKTLIWGFKGSLLLHLHLPTFFGALYFADPKRWNIGLLVPVGCMILFSLHPVGGQVFWYSFFWLIPFFISLKKSNSIFLRSLGSTFTVHAVGSVLWLYTLVYIPQTFKALLPIVPLERLGFALMMTLTIHMVQAFKGYALRRLSFQLSLS